MRAKPGDWLVVEARIVDGPARRGLIEEVHGIDGTPPFLVHWSDTGHRALTFPGPDARVLTSGDLDVAEAEVWARYTAGQHSTRSR
ncbi:DUF1918 domain-containing protein [Nocardia sp. BMG111209]|uniref:DUF1918 domain-containing protein n=1 Tax=Nocardia sp. BMG111209 TaxID=1160137 RepID=UPI00036FB8B8|nr:DUF1918 domain-containing protein [Nocardia sp. BMG111209]